MLYLPFEQILSEPIRNGLTKPKAIRGQGVKMIAMGEIFANSRISNIDMDRVPVTEKERTNCSIYEGDLLFARQSLTLEGAGKCSIVTKIEEDTVFESHLIRARVDTAKANPYFIYYFFNSPYGRETIKAIVEQVAAAGIRGSDLIKLEVPCPPIETQNRMVSLLNSIDLKIENNKKINENLQQQTQTLFREWFIDNPDVSSWEEGTFSDIIEKTISGDWGKDTPSGNNTEMVYCIRGADIPEVRAGNKGKMPTRFFLPKNYASKRLVDGDIVVEISGGSPTQSTGRAAAVSTALLDRYNKGMVCTNFCKALKPIAGYSMYVYHYWLYLYDMGVFFSYENGTTGIKNLDINGFIETEPIIIAPATLVEKFDAFCQSVFSKVYANGLENEQLALVRDTLLPKLMSGEIDVSNIQL